MIIFRDALFTNRRNEPWWFKIIRRVFALSFIFLIMIYGITQFRSIIDFLYAPNILIVESKNGVNFPGKKKKKRIFFFFLIFIINKY
jgi:hypothetical protein